MPNCVVKGCSSNSTNPHYDASGRKVTLHQFPTKATRADWIRILRERGGRNAAWEPNANAKICSVHFDEVDIDRTGQCVRIKPHALPLHFSALRRKSRKRPFDDGPPEPLGPPWPQPPPALVPLAKLEAALASPQPPLKAPTAPALVIAPPQAAPLLPPPEPPPVLLSSAPAPPPAPSPPPPPQPKPQPPPLVKVVQAPVRAVLSTRATLEAIAAPVLGSIVRGAAAGAAASAAALTKREQMLNSPAVTSTLVEKCIRRSKKFQELVSGEKDPSILRGLISKTLKEVNFYEALRAKLNEEKEKQINEQVERELRADMIMQEMKALTSTTKYSLQQAQTNFDNFFKMDLDMAKSKVKVMRAELQRNYFSMADKWERMAQIIEGETRKYPAAAASPPQAPLAAAPCLSNGDARPPLRSPPQEAIPAAPRPPSPLQMRNFATPDEAPSTPTEQSASSPPPQPLEFNPKTYLPKKHKAMLQQRQQQQQGDEGDGSGEGEVEVVSKKIKLEAAASPPGAECLA